LASPDADDLAASINFEADAEAVWTASPPSLRTSEKAVVRSGNVPCGELIAFSAVKIFDEMHDALCMFPSKRRQRFRASALKLQRDNYGGRLPTIKLAE
jgi:hypothetical protein